MWVVNQNPVLSSWGRGVTPRNMASIEGPKGVLQIEVNGNVQGKEGKAYPRGDGHICQSKGCNSPVKRSSLRPEGG